MSPHFFSTIPQACELRDGGSRYMGKGVLQAVKNVNEVLGPMVVGMDVTKQQEIDDVSSARFPPRGLFTDDWHVLTWLATKPANTLTRPAANQPEKNEKSDRDRPRPTANRPENENKIHLDRTKNWYKISHD